jgi:hypothetical protein
VVLNPPYRLLGVNLYCGQRCMLAHVLIVATGAVSQVKFYWNDKDGLLVPPVGWISTVFAEVHQANGTKDPLDRLRGRP